MDTITPQESASPNPVNLYDYALARAREAADRRELAKDAGAIGVDYSWYGKFARGKIPGASYEKVHQVATFYMAREAQQQEGQGQGAQAS